MRMREVSDATTAACIMGSNDGRPMAWRSGPSATR